MFKLCDLAVSFFFLLMIAGVKSNENKLKEIFRWKTVDFKFPNVTSRKEAIESGLFIPENVIPLAFEVWKNKLFITLTRWKSGYPASLTYINLDDVSGNQAPDLIPYPDWESNQLQDMNVETSGKKIISAVRANADACDRLWVIDMGSMNISGLSHQVSLPRLLIFDLNLDKQIKEYTIKKKLLKENSFLTNIVVDVTKESCAQAFAYVADADAGGLIVYDLFGDDSWRVDHSYFHFDPLSVNYFMGGVNYQSQDGVFGLALSSPDSNGNQTLFFHPLSSSREFAVSTQLLRSKSAPDSYYEFKVLGSRGPDSQSTVSSFDYKEGILFYTLVNKNAVGCWNSVKHGEEYSADTNAILNADEEALVYPNHLKVDENSRLWVLSNRLPVYFADVLNSTDVNFRILMATVSEMVDGTVCASSP